jgi:hypothetical protein
MAKYCTKRLPSTTDVLAIHNGKIVFGRFTNSQLPGLVFVSWLIKDTHLVDHTDISLSYNEFAFDYFRS